MARLVKDRRMGRLRGKRGGATTADGKFAEATEALFKEMPRVLDWASVVNPDLFAITFSQAKARSDRWHATLGEDHDRPGRTRKSALRRPNGVAHEVPSEKVVYRFENGWTVVDLTEWSQFREESAILHHCIGRSTTYYDDVRNGTYRVQSLRDPKRRSWLTITVETNGMIRYAKGFYDRLACETEGSDLQGRGHPHDLKEVAERLPEGLSMGQYLDLEARMLEEYVRHLRGDRYHTSDLGPDCVECRDRLMILKRSSPQIEGAANRRSKLETLRQLIRRAKERR